MKLVLRTLLIVLLASNFANADVLGEQTQVAPAPRRATEDELKLFLDAYNKEKDPEILLEYRSQDVSLFESGAHALWIADVNNDGTLDQVWLTEGAGSGHYDYLFIYDIENGILKEIELPLAESAELPTNLQNPPLALVNGKVVIRFVDIHCLSKSGKVVGEAANCNAARDTYYLVKEKIAYLLDHNKGRFLKKVTTRTRML